jgi:hypothetical protein
MATPPTGSDGQRDYRYSSTGVDLTAPIKLNPNPTDIESVNGRDKAYTEEKWRAFLRFATKSSKDENGNVIPLRVNVNDTSLNSKAVWESLTTDLINEFNTNKETSVWVQFGGNNPNRGLQNPISREDIFAIQRFTKKTDPNAQVDGWLGTQTLRMDYPKRVTYVIYAKDKNGADLPIPSETLLPVIWGNKRYIISYGDFDESNKNKKISYATLLKVYDPSIHTKDKFQKDPDLNRDWTSLAETVSVTKSAEKVNSETTKTAIKKQTQQLQTKLKSSF